MARFYGTLQGARGRVSRLGHASCGLVTVAASWSGAVRVRLYVDDDGRDCARITFDQHHGAGARALVYEGPIAPEGAVRCAQVAEVVAG